jgi:hypothetical protein
VITEPLTWHVLAESPEDLPDAELTVVIELDPAGDASEPVWLGFFDGTGWLDAMGDAVQVIAWADMPKGTAGVMPCCPPGEPHAFLCPNGAKGPDHG